VSGFPTSQRDARRSARCGLALLLTALFTAAPALADSVSTSTDKGFARIVFELEPMAHGSVALSGGVLIIAFDRKVEVESTAATQGLGAYVSSARLDPDGKTLRLALAQSVRPHTSVSGDRLAVDLVPATFAGLPPDLPAPPSKEPVVDVAKLPLLPVRAGRSANASRLVFEWPDKVAYTIFPSTGHLSLRFAAMARPDFSALEQVAPPWVKPAGWRVEDGATILEFALDSGSDHRVSRDGNKIVLDVLAPKTDATAATTTRTAVSYAQAQAVAAAAAKLKDEEPRPAASSPAPAAAAKAPLPTAGFADAPRPPASVVGAIVAKPVLPPLAPPRASAALTAGGAALIFPGVQTAAAFIRGATAWLVLDGGPPIDAGLLKSQLGDYANSLEASTSETTTILRLGLKQQAEIAAQALGANLRIEIGPHAASAAGDISLIRNDDAAKHAALATLLPGASHALKLADPTVGDTLIVVPASLGRALRASRSYLEFTALPTAAGLVLAPLGDDLDVTVAQSRVSITRPGGLALTPQAVPVADSPAILTRAGEGPTFLDFARWGRAADFLATTHTLDAQAASANPTTAFQGRLALARFYLAHGFAAEALGLIQLMQTADPALQSDRQLQTMRAAADYMMGRYRDARNDLADGVFDTDRHAALWRGLTEEALENPQAAAKDLVLAEAVLKRYPPEWQQRAKIASAQAAVETGKLDKANALLAGLPHDLPKTLMLESELVRARSLAASGRNRDAASLFHAAEFSGDERAAARAIYDRVETGLAAHQLSQGDAIDTLENLRFRWRGDGLELKTLRKLGALYLARGQWREGLQTLRTAAVSFPNEDAGRASQDDMRAAFETLFLKGKADKLAPVEALALFYDFIELTPIGPDGDRMIRRMADRLVAVDLLGPAAKLLDYQVSQRLDGVARAQVATRLAMLDLLDHKPKEALAALRSTRSSDLPDDINRERTLLEAQALAALKQWDSALDVIALDPTPESAKLRADIYWQSGNWELAGEKAEALLGQPTSAPLANAERETLMRAAISYSLAGNQPALDRLRTSFGAKLQGGPEATAFTLVTQKADTQGIAFRDLAAHIASIDTLETFMSDFRKRYSTVAD
jgi:hypothetical protein